MLVNKQKSIQILVASLLQGMCEDDVLLQVGAQTVWGNFFLVLFFYEKKSLERSAYQQWTAQDFSICFSALVTL